MASGMDVNARLTLDSAQFDANMKKSGEVATATGRAAAKAAKDSAAAQAVAAKFAGDAISSQSLRILEAQKAQSVASRELREVQGLVNRGALEGAAAANTEAAALQRVIAAKLASAAASHTQEHAQISQRMAASAAVRGLENGNVGIRAVENFLTTIPGVGAALQTVFPILGAGAMVAMLVKMGKELYDIGDKASHAGKAIAEAFEDQHEKAVVANDDLAITNDRLGDEIAKLSGHPSNGLETALDKSRQMADKLLESLQADRKELDALLKEHEVGALGSVLSGVATTGKQATEVTGDQAKLTQQVRAARDAFDNETVGVKDAAKLKAATDKRNAAVRAAYQSQINTYKVEGKRLEAEQADARRNAEFDRAAGGTGAGFTDNSAKIAIIQGRTRQIEDALKRESLTESIGQREAIVGGLKAAKEGRAEESKEAELRYKAMEAHVAEWKTLAPVTAGAIYEYWDGQRNAFAVGSAQYNSIVEKQATLAVEMARKAAEEIKKHQADMKRLDEEAQKLPQNPMGAWQRDDRKAGAEKIDASNEANAQAARNTARQAEVAIQEASGHTMTRIAAATELAAVHTREYGAELDRLVAKQKAVSESRDEEGHEGERAKELAALNKQIEAQKAGRTVQIMQDQYNINGPDSSAAVGGKEALEEFTKAALDSASQMKNMVNGAIRDINRTLLEELTTKAHGPRHLWTNVGKDLAKNATGSLLEHGEGMLLKGLGVGGGKLGTSGNPMWVRMAATAASTAAGAVKSAAGGVGGFLGSLLKGAIPGFAGGGDPAQNSMAWVGENGPELVRFGSQRASVIPNHALPMGGAGDMHFHVDARGATDPAAVMSMVHQGLRQAAPQIMAATIQAQRSGNARIPSSQRR